MLGAYLFFFKQESISWLISLAYNSVAKSRQRFDSSQRAIMHQWIAFYIAFQLGLETVLASSELELPRQVSGVSTFAFTHMSSSALCCRLWCHTRM